MVRASIFVRLPVVLWSATAMLGMYACGGTGVIPTKPPTAASFQGMDKAPLVVDWPVGQRSDLEAAAHDGVAVVHVANDGIKLLHDCRLPGSYGFLGVTTKEQLLRFEDAAELSVNLPLRGAGLAADLGADLGGSVALDVALVTVGKRRTTRAAAKRSSLQGSECATATHFVRGFDVGAFVLATSEKQSVQTVAALFSAKAKYDRKSKKQVREVDGILDSCKAGKPGDAAPPDQCGAALRLDLKALDEDEKVEVAGCSEGLARTGGKCVPRARVRVYECNPSNADECRTQCEAGNADSCGYYAFGLRKSTDKAPDFAEVKKYADKGCEAGSERACVVGAELMQFGNGVPIDYAAAAKVYERACNGGLAAACFRLGTLYDRRPGLPEDHTRAMEQYDRACRGGYADGCNNQGALVLHGRGAPASPERSRTIYEAACKNGSGAACGNLGDLLVDGIGGAKDVARAEQLWTQACEVSGAHCVRLGNALAGDGPFPKDAMRSLEAFQKGTKLLTAHCNLGMADRCDELGWVFHDGKATSRDDAQALVQLRKACTLGAPRSCNHVGIFLERGWGGRADPVEAKKMYGTACDGHDEQACVNLAMLSTGKERDDLLDRACVKGAPAGCFHQARSVRIAGDTKKAKQVLTKACNDGHAESCAYIARWTLRDMPGDPGAIKQLETACQKNDPEGCATLSEVLAKGRGAEERAEAAGRKGCDLGSHRACGALADLGMNGRAKNLKEVEASEVARKACDSGDMRACVSLASHQRSDQQGIGILDRACDKNQAMGDSVELVKMLIERHAGRPMFSNPGASHSAASAAAAEADRAAADMIAGRSGNATSGVLAMKTPTADLSIVGRSRTETKGASLASGLASAGGGPIRPGGGGAGLGGIAGTSGGSSGASGMEQREIVPQGPSAVTLERMRLDKLDAGNPNPADIYLGCKTLARIHDLGEHGEVRPSPPEKDGMKTREEMTRIMYLQGACVADDGRSCRRWMDLAHPSKPGEQNIIVRTIYGHACDLGDAEGCVKADRPERAVPLFLKLCEAQEAAACFEASKLVGKSIDGQPADKAKAKELRSRACSLGQKSAC